MKNLSNNTRRILTAAAVIGAMLLFRALMNLADGVRAAAETRIEKALN